MNDQITMERLAEADRKHQIAKARAAAIEQIETALASIEPSEIIMPKLSERLEKYSCGCTGNRGACLARQDGEFVSHLYKFSCDCLVSSEEDHCSAHPTATRAYIKPHRYRGPFVAAIHNVPDWDNTPEHSSIAETKMMIALHRCRKDEHGFLHRMECIPITELYPIEQMHEQGSDYEQAWEKLIPPSEHTAFRGDVCTMFNQMPAEHILEKV